MSLFHADHNGCVEIDKREPGPILLMHDDQLLKGKMETILKRLLLDTGKKEFDWTKHRESWFSVLATRVQMGSTSIDVASNLVAKGYAILTGVTSKTLQHSSRCPILFVLALPCV